MQDGPTTRARLSRTAAWLTLAVCVALFIVSVVYGWLSVGIHESSASWSGGGFLANALFVVDD